MIRDFLAEHFTIPCIDPLAEKYYGISPYAYCGGDPVNRGDYTGLFPDSLRATIAQQINVAIDNSWFGSGTTGDVKKLESTENYQAREENAYYFMNCEYDEKTGEYIATAEFKMDKTPISIVGNVATGIEIACYAMYLSPETACFAPAVSQFGDKLGNFSFVASQFTDWVNGDMSMKSVAWAVGLKSLSSLTKGAINNYFPSTGYSHINNELNSLLKIIDTMYYGAVSNISDAVINNKRH